MTAKHAATTTVGESIQRRREDIGLSRKAFADLAGIPSQALYKIETGITTKPWRSTLEKIEAGFAAASKGGGGAAAGDQGEEPEDEDGEAAEQGTCDDEARGAALLEGLDSIIQIGIRLRTLLAPDEAETSRPVKSRDIAALAERLAAVEETLIRAGLMR